MIGDAQILFWLISGSTVMILAAGFYCVLATFNLLRVLIGLEILMKGVTLFMIGMGYVSGQPALAQGMVMTMIVIEVVVMVVAAGVVLGVFRLTDSVNIKHIRELKG